MNASNKENARPLSQVHARTSQDSCSSSMEMGHLLQASSDDSDGDEPDLRGGEAHISSTDYQNFPEGGFRAWSVVAGAFFMMLPSFGLMNSVGTFEDYWQGNQLSSYTTRDIGWIPSVFVYFGLALGIQVGPLFDRHGCRILAAVGSLGHVLMLLLLAVCREYWQFLLSLGFLGGVTSAILTTTALAAVSHWFRDRRGLAAGITMLGSSTGGVIIPLMLQVTLPKYGWTTAIRILALLTLGCMVLGYVCIKTRLPPALDKRAVIDLSIFKDLRFVFTTVGTFCIEVVLFGTLGLMPSYMRSQGLPGSSGSFQIAVINSVSCFGRVFGGIFSDSFGHFNMMLLMMIAALLTCLMVWLPSGQHLPLLYIFSALFGFASGTWMSLVPVCVGQICKTEDFGRYFGTVYAFASFATLITVPIGGEILETHGAKVLICIFSLVLLFGILLFILARWACLKWRWVWLEKV